MSVVKAKEFLPIGRPGPERPGDNKPLAGQTWAKKVDQFHKAFINKSIKNAEELHSQRAGPPGCSQRLRLTQEETLCCTNLTSYDFASTYCR